MPHPLRSRHRILAASLAAASCCGVVVAIWIQPPAVGTARTAWSPSADRPGAVFFAPPPASPAPGWTAVPEPPSAPPPSPADEEALLRQIAEARRETDAVRRHELLVAVCLRWADFDPPEAVAFALELGLDTGEDALLPNLAQQWAARDFPAALAWANQIPVEDLRDQVYSRLAYERARTEPAAAARLLAGMRPGGAERAEAAITVLHLWATHDPAAARAWAETFFPAGPPRERARAELAAMP